MLLLLLFCSFLYIVDTQMPIDMKYTVSLAVDFETKQLSQDTHLQNTINTKSVNVRITEKK